MDKKRKAKEEEEDDHAEEDRCSLVGSFSFTALARSKSGSS